jgi:peptidylprolyl isomerase domain and WD repeat-containing protein 1
MSKKRAVDEDDATPPREDGGDNDEQPDDDESDDDMPMPMPMPAKKKKRKVLEFERLYVENLPSADMYEKSYMHRDVVTHVVVTPHTDFVVTASVDGHLKFWKKMPELVEFVKHYRAHLTGINSLSCSADGLWLCTTGDDRAAKFYDVVNFDMVNMVKLAYLPKASCWIHRNAAPHPRVAIADDDTGNICVYNAMNGSDEPIQTVKCHSAPVQVMAYNADAHTVVSADSRGLIEYWGADDYEFPDSGLKFKFKTETSLYELAKSSACPVSIAFSPTYNDFVIVAKDCQIRVFSYKTGKMRRKYDESQDVFDEANDEGTLGIDNIDFGRRSAVERELVASEKAPPSNAVFDETGNFLLYPTLIGIKVGPLSTFDLLSICFRPTFDLLLI